MDKEIISLLVFGSIALLSTWLNKRRQARAEREQQQPPFSGEGEPSQPSPPRRPSSWEEELRKLLEGETSAPPLPHREPVYRPPPLVLPMPTARPAPPPVSVERPAPVFSPPARPAAAPVTAPATAELLQQAHAQQEEARRVLMQAEERVRSALQHAHVPAAQAPVSGIHIRKMLHNHHTLRSAFVASLVFGAPKGLADQ